MFVLDTSTLICFFKGIGDVPARLLETPPGKITIPAIVLYELEYGISKSSHVVDRRAQLNELCSLVKVLPYGKNAAKISASVRSHLKAIGKPIGAYDLLIAGTTLANHGVLVTTNTKEFAKVPELELDNWC